MMTESEPRNCSTEMTQIVLEGAREVLNSAEMTALFESAGVRLPDETGPISAPGNDIQRLAKALETRYGPLGSRGTAVRIGRASFQGVMQVFGSEDGFEDEEYRMLPVRKRARAGLEKLAAIFECACGIHVAVTTEPEAWLWTLADCETCHDPRVETAVSHFMLGLLREYLAWSSGGKVFQVEEIACRADGDPNCVLRVLRLPLD
ncbi:MAG: hypothetical protein C0396_03975 [Anaerolinea sp.]|nr:hypothetical protein [Anaerolinea sp.]